jgi:hypothetical protein
VLISAVCLFLLVGMFMLPLPGFEADELLFIKAWWHPETVAAHISIFRHWFPLMAMTYVGALKSWLFAPLLSVLGTNTWAVRLPPLLLTCLTLVLLAIFLRRICGWTAALFSTWLLATDATLLYTSIMDWGPVVLQNLLLVSGLLLFERWHVKRRRFLFFSGALCFGLALWDKALFFWNLGGMAVAFLIVGFSFIRRNLRWQLLLAGGLGFLLGAWPLIRYNIRHRGATLAENTDFVYDQIDYKIRYLQLAVDDKASIAPFADYTAPAPAAPIAAPFGHSAIVLSKKLPVTSAGPRFWLIVAMLTAGIILGSGVQRRWAAFFALTASLAWIQSAVTPNSGGSLHHSVLLWPLLYAGAGLGAGAIATRLGRFGPPAVALLTAVFAVWGLLAFVQMYAMAVSVSFRPQFSSADRGLGEYLGREHITRAIVTDWGIGDLIDVRTNRAVQIDDQIVQIRDNQLNVSRLQDCLLPSCTVVAYVTHRDVFPNQGEKLDQELARSNLRRHAKAVITDALGTPMFQLFQVGP